MSRLWRRAAVRALQRLSRYIVGASAASPPLLAKGPMSEFTARTVPSIDQHPRRRRGTPAPTRRTLSEQDASGERYNPFISHAFLNALERSRSVGGRTGWTVAHVLVEAEGRLVACAPAYVKTNSMGEYVFDHSWAHAYESAGGSYYPKLQVAAPFTPVTGRRLLVAPDAPPGAREALIAALRGLREAVKASSVHVTFANAADAEALGAAGFARRTGEQFHFLNEGYADFEAFLAALASRKRKAIRRERRDALGDEVAIDLLTGARHQINALGRVLRVLHGHRLAQMGPALSHPRVLRGDRRAAWPTACCWSWRGGARATSPGRSTFSARTRSTAATGAAIEERPFLHFEVCYYQAIEYAIRHGFARVEAGAQGEHKLARGYRPGRHLFRA